MCHSTAACSASDLETLNAELNPICHLLALLAPHILHVSRVRGKGHFKPLKAELKPICHLLALLAHHILHISRIRGKGHFKLCKVRVTLYLRW